MSEIELIEVVEDSNVRRRNNDSSVNNNNWQIPIEEFTSKLTSDETLYSLKWKQKRFYKHQNEIIHSLLSAQQQVNNVNTVINEEEQEEILARDLSKKIAIYGSVCCNIVLFLFKVIVAYLSGSLSVIASALDSFLDLLSGLILFLTEYIANKSSEDDYPTGKSKFEPVGIVIFSSCMFTATLQLLISSIETLIDGDLILNVDYATICVLILTIITKFGLWMYCRKVSHSESVAALALDHRNDVISNIFGATTALLGFYVAWWIDPIGAVFISMYLMFIWARTGFSQLSSLTGKTASPEILQTLTFIARNHHPAVIAIDTVRAYHYGYNYMCEVDIVLDPDTPLRIAHDIGEALQNKLEVIDKVERAFVHLDYEWEHKPEHNGSRLYQD